MGLVLKISSLILFLFYPAITSASEASHATDYYLPLWFVTPFVLMLMCIAILPLTVEKWWHKNINKFWISLILGLPIGIYFAIYDARALSEIGLEYFSFIILLASLFIVSGGILLKGDIEATPLINTVFLLIGSVLASFMGTTGAAMLLVRPLLSTNKERKYVVHTVVFFIFIVSNIGGCLTPLGDPPLFMGYLMGVPFQWTFGLTLEWGFVVVVLLILYFIIDSIFHSKEPISRLAKDRREIKPIRIHGLVNIPLLLGIVLTVAFITKIPYREIIMIIISLISLKVTKKTYRTQNEFNWAPILEVAVLFFGIFLTMIPAIVLLHTRGAELGITTPSEFYWLTGTLSAFLDNTPTYVTFFALGQVLNFSPEIAGVPETILIGISLGAVFFGAITYIGNAPNFMVKVIAEQKKIKMPSFFGYMMWSVPILIPIFLIVDFLFVR